MMNELLNASKNRLSEGPVGRASLLFRLRTHDVADCVSDSVVMRYDVAR